MKTDKKSRDIIIILIAIIMLALATFVLTGCKPSSAHATTKEIPENVNYKEQCKHLSEVLHCYNVVLHRVWIDRPAYVEDALCETEEYIRLEQLLTKDMYNEIFSFYDEKDSIEYHDNWFGNDPLDGEPGCYIGPEGLKNIQAWTTDNSQRCWCFLGVKTI